MYIKSHSESKCVQTEGYTLGQEEFSTSVDKDDFIKMYGEMDDEKFHYIMQAQDRKFCQTFSNPVFLFNETCDSQVNEKCDLAVFSSGSTKDLDEESILSTSKLPVWNEDNSKFLDWRFS